MEHAFNEFMKKRNQGASTAAPSDGNTTVFTASTPMRTAGVSALHAFCLGLKLFMQMGVVVLLMELATRGTDRSSSVLAFASYVFGNGKTQNYYLMLILYVASNAIQWLLCIALLNIVTLPTWLRNALYNALSVSRMHGICLGIAGIEFVCVYIWMREYTMLYWIVCSDALLSLLLWLRFVYHRI
jgi:hypothetical protein